MNSAGTAVVITDADARACRDRGVFQRDRLPYVLPDFTRISWVSDRARATSGSHRIQRIGSAWAEIEWRSVVVRHPAVRADVGSADRLVPRSTEWAAHGPEHDAGRDVWHDAWLREHVVAPARRASRSNIASRSARSPMSRR